VYTIFAPYSSSYTLSHLLSLPQVSTSPGKIFSALWLSDFVKEKIENFVYLR
jgi:hypothetical protein